MLESRQLRNGSQGQSRTYWEVHGSKGSPTTPQLRTPQIRRTNKPLIEAMVVGDPMGEPMNGISQLLMTGLKALMKKKGCSLQNASWEDHKYVYKPVP